MTINGIEYKMLLTVRARKEIRALCPDGKMENFVKLFDDEENGDEVMVKLIATLSKCHEDYAQYWAAQSGQNYEPHVLTEEMIENLSSEDYLKLSEEASSAFLKGMGVTVETEPVKEKGKKKEVAKSENP